jgi:hypothetical protein
VSADAQPPTRQDQPARVSDEDRAAAIKAVALSLASGIEDEVKYFRGTAAEAVDALVPHGWRPEPRVSDELIEKAARILNPGAFEEHVTQLQAINGDAEEILEARGVAREIALKDAQKLADAGLLVSHGWGPTRQIQIETLMAARDAAREARRICWAEDRDEHTIRHWGATAGWLASRARKIEAGDEPDWPDAANSATEDPGLEVTE